MHNFLNDGYRPPPPGVDATRPSAARMYDAMLGGRDHFTVDREALAEIESVIPELRGMAVTNRRFLGRAVRFLAAETGITQFLDIGSGLPAQNPTDQVAHRHSPYADTRVVYVDHDPMVVVHARALLADDTRATLAVEGDLRHPEQILTNPYVSELLDFRRPVAVLLVAVLHFLPDDQHPERVVRTLREALAPGSYIAISHVDNARDPQRAAFLEEFYTERGIPGQTRSPMEIDRLFDRMELVDPGLGYIEHWRPDLALPGPDTALLAPAPTAATALGVYGGLGRVPDPTAPGPVAG